MDETEKIYLSQRAVLASYSVYERKKDDLANLLQRLNSLYDEENIQEKYSELRNDPEWFDSIRNRLHRDMDHRAMTQFVFDTENYLRTYFERNVLNRARELTMEQIQEVNRDLAYLGRYERDMQLPSFSRIGVEAFPLEDVMSGADTDFEED